MPSHEIGESLTRLQRGLTIVLVIGLLGTGTELLLMGHTEGLDQLIPLILIGLGLVTLTWYRWKPTPASRGGFRFIMVVSVLSGALGSVLHYKGNVEFELESMPGLRGFELFKQSMTGATPALAPGTMVLLGALGLLLTVNHNPGHSTIRSNEET